MCVCVCRVIILIPFFMDVHLGVFCAGNVCVLSMREDAILLEPYM